MPVQIDSRLHCKIYIIRVTLGPVCRFGPVGPPALPGLLVTPLLLYADTLACPTGQRGFHEMTADARSYCYYVSQDRRTWFSARQACKSLSADADLATIHNEQIRSVLKERYLVEDKYWIGLVGLVWYWINGMTSCTVCIVFHKTDFQRSQVNVFFIMPSCLHQYVTTFSATIIYVAESCTAV